MEDVINEVRELFLDEGVDEQVLMELKTVSEENTWLGDAMRTLRRVYDQGLLEFLK